MKMCGHLKARLNSWRDTRNRSRWETVPSSAALSFPPSSPFTHCSCQTSRQRPCQPFQQASDPTEVVRVLSSVSQEGIVENLTRNVLFKEESLMSWFQDTRTQIKVYLLGHVHLWIKFSTGTRDCSLVHVGGIPPVARGSLIQAVESVFSERKLLHLCVWLFVLRENI